MGCTSPRWQTPNIWQPAIATGILWPLVPLPYILASCEVYHYPIRTIFLMYVFHRIILCKTFFNESAVFPFVKNFLCFFLPPYGFLLFSLLVVFLLQECPISLIPGVVQVLSYQAIVGSQPILLNILQKTESFLFFGAHHSSRFHSILRKTLKMLVIIVCLKEIHKI